MIHYKQIKIKSKDIEYNQRIIKYLESLNARNSKNFTGYVTETSYYYIENGLIECTNINNSNLKYYLELNLDNNMEIKNNEIRIEIPKGMEIDKENSTFECIRFKPKNLTYGNIAKNLFYNKKGFFITSIGNIESCTFSDNTYLDGTNCVSKIQANKLLALNKFFNVAKYLNEDWKPDFEDYKQIKYYIYLYKDKFNIEGWPNSNFGVPCFKSEALARQAIEILGKETIKLAISQI